MRNTRAFRQKLAAVGRLWDEKNYDAALIEVEGLLKAWPGNAHLHILWASLVQLQERPTQSLDEAKEALQRAIELDKTAPAGPIELGHFLDAVEDDPHAAAKAYSEGVAAARQLLIDGLIGKAKALLQLDKRVDALRCLLEVLHLMQFQPLPKGSKSAETGPDFLLNSLGRAVAVEAQSPFGDHLQELLNEVISSRSA